MARLLRSTSRSFVGKPAVVDAAVVFRPISVMTAACRTVGDYTRRRSIYKLEPPTAVTPIVPFMAVPISTTTAPSPTQARSPHSKLAKPASIAPGVVFPGPEAKLATLNKQSPAFRKTTNDLRPPTVLGVVFTFVATPIRAAIAKWRNPRLTSSKLQTPATIRAATVFPGPEAHLTRTPRAAYSFRYDLRPPTVLGAVAVFVFRPVQVFLTRTRQQPPTTKKIRPPAATAPSIVFSPVRAELARTPQSYYLAKSRLNAPTVTGAVVTFVFRPIQVALTRTRQQPPTTKRLRPPATVAPAAVFRAVQAKLVRTPQNYYKTKSRLNGPTIMGAVIAVAFRPILVALTRTRQQPPTTKKISPPAAVAPARVSRPVLVRNTYTPHPDFRSAKPKLRPPTSLGAFLARAVQVMLAKVRKYPIPVKSKLRPPARVATATVFRPVLVRNTYSKRKIQARYVLRAPTKVTIPLVLPPVDVGGRIGDWDTGRIDFTDEGRIQGPE